MDVILLSGGLTDSLIGVQRYIGPYKIAHWLRKHGYSVQVVDFVHFLDQELLEKILRKFITNKTLVLGVSTTFFSTNTSPWEDGTRRFIPEFLHKAIQNIKTEFSQLKVILGGYMSEKIPSYGIFDATVMSYTVASEDIFLEYVNHLRTGSPPPPSSLAIPLFKGRARIHYYDSNTKVYNIETDDFTFTEQDNILPGEPLPLDVSRGCIFACRFCQYPHLGKKKLDYIRGMEYIEAEMNNNYNRWGTTSYYVLDDTFNDTEIKLQAFLDMSKRLPFKLDYSAYIRADLVHRFPDTAHMLQESGIFGAFHGIESLHPGASKLVAKGWSGQHAREYIPELYHNIWNKKVAQHLSFIVGLTGESPEDVRQTAQWFLDNDLPSIRFKPLGLFGPGGNTRMTIQSEFDRNAEKYGYTIHNVAENGRVNWSNDYWNNKSTVELVDILMAQVKPHLRHSSWTVLGLQWYGYTRDQITTLKRKEYDGLVIKQKIQYYKSMYFDRLLQ